jgi:hypothetical protein
MIHHRDTEAQPDAEYFGKLCLCVSVVNLIPVALKYQ